MLFKAKVPEAGRDGSIFLQTEKWSDAREICRRLHHDSALEANWRAMERVEEGNLVPGDFVYWRDEEREIRHGIVKKLGAVPTKVEKVEEPVWPPKPVLKTPPKNKPCSKVARKGR